MNFEKETGVDRESGVTKRPRIVPILLLIVTVLVFLAYGIKEKSDEAEEEQRAEATYPLFSDDDYHDVSALAARLAEREDRVSKFIWQQTHALDAWTGLEPQGSSLEEKVSAILNAIVELDDWIYDKARFEGVTLRTGTAFTGNNRSGFGNRYLLEDAYPDLIKKRHEVVPELTTAEVIGPVAKNFSTIVVKEFPAYIGEQLSTVWLLILYALIPGIAGLIYRRAFLPWFLLAFAVLFALNSIFAAEGHGRVLPDAFYLFIELQLLVILMAYSLRRHVAVASKRSPWKNVIIPIVLLLAAVFLAVWQWGVLWWQYVLWIELAIGLLVVAYVLYKQPHREGSAPKNIVLCMDGTWNHPGQTDFGYLAQTNVFKLYSMLQGQKTKRGYNAARSKTYETADQTRQVSFYFHGVGNRVENSAIGQAIGGAFGLGADSIIERAYLDVVRVYKPGDRIFIFGFSRGAAIARLIAGVIGRRDVPKSLWTLRLFGKHWSIWKSRNRFEDVKVEVLSCWDTVGAFGISKNILGIPFQKINLLKDLSVSDCVKRAYHLVALDERRDAFEPTLMDADPTDQARIVEVWFPGNHSNVGGGYATDGLSDLALRFVLERVTSGYSRTSSTTTSDESWGLYLRKDLDHGVEPNEQGKIRTSTGAVYSYAPRPMPLPSVVHDSVFARMKHTESGYAPESVFNLSDELVKQQEFIAKEVGNLARAEAFDKEEAKQIVDGSRKHLTLTKWTDWKKQLGARLDPPGELANAAVD